MEKFERALLETGYLHAPLPIDTERSMEERIAAKAVSGRRALWDGALDRWKHEGRGELTLSADEAGAPALRMRANVLYDHWPEGASPDGDYTNFGTIKALLTVPGEDWGRFNRISFRVRPDCPGSRRVHLNMHLGNDGAVKIPDIYWREGCHVINLENHRWTRCIWEFPDLPRDKVTAVAFYVFLNGKDITTGDYVQFDIADIELQHVSETEPSLGWACQPGRVSFSTTGYWTTGAKTAVAPPDVKEFSVVDEGGAVAFSGNAQAVHNFAGDFAVLDFTALDRPGRYRIRAGGALTESFSIGPTVMRDAVWKVVNFLFCERCGGPVSGRHGSCHRDFIAEHNGLKLVYNGGWHDAGDVSQQTLQSGEVTRALLEMALKVKGRELQLYNRLMEEAEWGLDFLLKTRFGDGYRATSAGATRWTQGFIGDMDDVAVRVHCHALENFLGAGIEAFAAVAMKDRDAEMAWRCGEAARQDFAFAEERFRTHGIELPIYFEHTYNTGFSQFAATASWAASQIYALTGEERYAARAREYLADMLACQDTGDAGLPIQGFFYRDRSKGHIVHYNHQSRDYAFAQALEAICTTQRSHPDRPVWEEAFRLHARYLKDLMGYATPYGMLPAGVYGTDEAEDKETFALLHLQSNYETEKANYVLQVKNGAPVGPKHYVRQFPVWFSFRGNLAVHLATGKAAAVAGAYFHDEALTEAARAQLYWAAGRNPFCQSLMYGEGSNYAQEYAVLPGEMVGELPVGVQTLGNGDEPYWPQANNATYKEVWTSSAGHWLWVAAELYDSEAK